MSRPIFGVVVMDPNVATHPRLARDYPPAATMRFDLGMDDPDTWMLLPFVATGELRAAMAQAEAAFKAWGYVGIDDVLGVDASGYVAMGRVDGERLRGLASGETRPVGHPVVALLGAVPNMAIWFRKALEGGLFTPEVMRDGLRVGVELTSLHEKAPPPPPRAGASGPLAGAFATFSEWASGAPAPGPDPLSWEAARRDLLQAPPPAGPPLDGQPVGAYALGPRLKAIVRASPPAARQRAAEVKLAFTLEVVEEGGARPLVVTSEVRPGPDGSHTLALWKDGQRHERGSTNDGGFMARFRKRALDLACAELGLDAAGVERLS